MLYPKLQLFTSACVWPSSGQSEADDFKKRKEIHGKSLDCAEPKCWNKVKRVQQLQESRSVSSLCILGGGPMLFPVFQSIFCMVLQVLSSKVRHWEVTLRESLPVRWWSLWPVRPEVCSLLDCSVDWLKGHCGNLQQSFNLSWFLYLKSGCEHTVVKRSRFRADKCHASYCDSYCCLWYQAVTYISFLTHH